MIPTLTLPAPLMTAYVSAVTDLIDELAPGAISPGTLLLLKAAQEDLSRALDDLP